MKYLKTFEARTKINLSKLVNINNINNNDPKIKDSYEYQKTLLEIDPQYSKTLKNIHPKIEREFKHIFTANKYNL